MHSKAWLAARVSLRLARPPRTASSAQRSHRLCSTRAAAPVLLAHAEVTKNIIRFSMGPKLRYPPVPAYATDVQRNTTSARQHQDFKLTEHTDISATVLASLIVA